MGGAFDEDAGAGAAVLSGVVEEGHGGGGRGGLQVGVGEDDVGALAAEFEGDALEVRGALGPHLLADGRRPGEDDLGDAGVFDEGVPGDRAVPGEHLEHALRKAGLQGESGEAQGGEGVVSAGLRRTAFPAARAGAAPQAAMGMGKFQGAMTPTTPSGSRKVTSTPPGTGICRPVRRSTPRPRSRADRGRCPPPSGRCRGCGRPRGPPAGRVPRRGRRRRRRTGAADGRVRRARGRPRRSARGPRGRRRRPRRRGSRPGRWR